MEAPHRAIERMVAKLVDGIGVIPPQWSSVLCSFRPLTHWDSCDGAWWFVVEFNSLHLRGYDDMIPQTATRDDLERERDMIYIYIHIDS